jgi:lipopolysaccharide/colanic/teichoic acid biosynthesis glycosyltransferase
VIEPKVHQPEPDRGAEPNLARSKQSYKLAKRLLDMLIAGAALLLFSPLWILIGLAIRATSRGPALYRGRVVGKDGKPFTYYKFRTMIAGDDSHHRQWLKDFVLKDAPYQGGQFKVLSDPRVTRVGRFLRRFSLDEVPQLINVLRGEMSIVGPRPPVPFEFELYDARARRRLAVKPGITGLYQVSARSQVPFSRMLAIDLDYIQRRSLLLDLQIMFRTIGVMLGGHGAA